MMDYKAIFRQSPSNIVIFDVSQDHIILEASDCYIEAIGKDKEELVGKKLIEAFPDGPNGWNTESRAILVASFNEVIKYKRFNRMPVVRYDIPIEGQKDKYDITYWSPENYPILDKEGNVKYLLHIAINVTRIMTLGK